MYSQTLNDHIQVVHYKDPKYQCDLCDEWFITTAKRSTHREEAHKGAKPLKNVIGKRKDDEVGI